MWLIADYCPVTLFSLKSGEATSTGAKTLFLPTPFAIRTALLDVAIRTRGIESGPSTFEAVKGLALAIRPPERLVVTNLFTKVQKPDRSEDRARKTIGFRGTSGTFTVHRLRGPGCALQKSIAFREYAYLAGSLVLAFEGDEEALGLVETLLPQINYFGKRGSFFQWLPPARREAALPAGFILLDGTYITEEGVKGEPDSSFPLGLIQMMDDWGPSLTYAKVNVYDPASIKRPGKGEDRVRKGIVLPYRLVRSSRSFSYYERI